ncbi:hypothetical protein RJ640_010459 [Escallonia rubra]|uniref:Peptidase S9A N-terminal domain-containing protein n=1 Tax=Escallonia rubra TaxID=112253 RepID=A0AA88RIH0_9ASTE|nr:hypothetical protein RJ640_010459 [Escallonia rubra]
MTSAGTKPSMPPPVAKKVRHEMEMFGDVRIDDYYWLRDDSRSDPEVLSYLHQENAYTDSVMSGTSWIDTFFPEPAFTLLLQEWGDPRKEEYYFYMKSYSPVDNIAARKYPVILVTAGLNEKTKKLQPLAEEAKKKSHVPTVNLIDETNDEEKEEECAEEDVPSGYEKDGHFLDDEDPPRQPPHPPLLVVFYASRHIHRQQPTLQQVVDSTIDCLHLYLQQPPPMLTIALSTYCQ